MLLCLDEAHSGPRLTIAKGPRPGGAGGAWREAAGLRLGLGRRSCVVAVGGVWACGCPWTVGSLAFEVLCGARGPFCEECRAGRCRASLPGGGTTVLWGETGSPRKHCTRTGISVPGKGAQGST